MALWKPDPTFYPSPKMAMEAPPEKLAFVAMLNTGNGNATVNLISLGGHTSVNSTGGSDTITLDDNLAHTLQHDQGLLTVGSDIPQAVVTDLADGSPAGVSLGVGTLGTIQLEILAAGGTFGLSFNGGSPTGDLAFKNCEVRFPDLAICKQS